jgi:hypothetical protein
MTIVSEARTTEDRRRRQALAVRMEKGSNERG